MGCPENQISQLVHSLPPKPFKSLCGCLLLPGTLQRQSMRAGQCHEFIKSGGAAPDTWLRLAPRKKCKDRINCLRQGKHWGGAVCSERAAQQLGSVSQALLCEQVVKCPLSSSCRGLWCLELEAA